MSASETALVAFTICSNVLFVPQPKLANCLLDDLKASFISHGLGTGKIPKIDMSERGKHDNF